MPGAEPPVYSPVALMVPPVAVQFTVGVVLLPSLMLPLAENCTVAPVCTEVGDGVTLTDTSVGGAVTVTVAVPVLPVPGSVAVT